LEFKNQVLEDAFKMHALAVALEEQQQLQAFHQSSNLERIKIT